MTPFESLVRLPKPACIALTLSGILLVGAVDHSTGFDVSLSVFYALPVLYAARSLGRRYGTAAALLAVGIWFFVDLASGHQYSHPWVPGWNLAVRFGFLMLVVTGTHYARTQIEDSQARADALEQALPICTCCKKIRDEYGSWLDVESYVMDHFTTEPAHKLCPDCSKRAYIRQVAPLGQKVSVQDLPVS